MAQKQLPPQASFLEPASYMAPFAAEEALERGRAPGKQHRPPPVTLVVGLVLLSLALF